MATQEIATKKPGFFARLGKKIADFFVGLWEKISGFFINFYRRFRDGSFGTKMSHFIFGFGSFTHGQIIKGIIFLLLQVGIIAFMVLCPEINGTPYGYKALINLSLGGNEPGMDPVTLMPIAATDDKLRLLFGLATIAVIILYFIIWNSNIKSSYKADMDVKIGKKPTTFVQDLKELLDSRFHIMMLTPTMLAALVFTILPTIFMICIAFTSYNEVQMSSDGTKLFYWTGFNNFVQMFAGQSKLGAEIKGRFFPVLGWTVVWAIFATLTCYFGGILLALLINKKGLKGKKIFRTFFVVTIAVTQFISLLAVRNLFNDVGPINQLLKDLGWISESIKFFGGSASDPGNEYLAKLMVIIINMWLGIPYTMLMTSGILMNIPADLYEAGTVDGASKTKMFFKITLPYIIFVTTPYLISSFIGNINSFNTIFLLTGGNPAIPGYTAGGTDLLVTWLYKLTIDSEQFNTGAVIGILTFLITATITLITYRNSKAYKEEDTFQ